MPKHWKVLHIVVMGIPGHRTVITPEATFDIEEYPLGTEKTLSMLKRMLFIPKRLGDYDLVITSEYFISFAMNLRLILSLCRTRHVTNPLNQSRRLLKTGISGIDRVIERIFRRNDLFIVPSRHEMSLFHKLHNIPVEKFCFSFWGFDLPAIRLDNFAKRGRDYVCMIGRNNRDIETFCSAAEGLDIDLILITSRHQAIPDRLQPTVHVYQDLSMEDCLSCIKYARANLILVKDDERGAGHITAVAAMMLGVPQIVSEARVLRDYFVQGYNCLTVPIGDAAAVRSAIDRVLCEPEQITALTRNGHDYAFRWLTHQATEARIFGVVGDLLAGRVVNQVDPQWEAENAGRSVLPR